MKTIDPKDFDATARLTQKARLITLALSAEDVHPRDQIAVHLICISLAMAAGLRDDMTDEEAADMLRSIIPETVAMYRHNKQDFDEFKKKLGV